jgi:DNA-binding CsgD family transcriptional regulator
VADEISRQAFSDLIGSIYDCALDPSRWDQTLAEVKDALDCHVMTLTLSDLRHDRLLLYKAAGIAPYQMEQVSKHVPEIDAILGGALKSGHSLDEPYVISRHIAATYFETSPHFQEWAKPLGMADFMVFFLMHTPMHLCCFTGGRHVRQGIITDREIELGKLLLPHVRRVVTISNVLDIRAIEGTRMAEALDALRCARRTDQRTWDHPSCQSRGRTNAGQGRPHSERKRHLASNGSIGRIRAPLRLRPCGRERGRHWQDRAGDPPHRARRAAHLCPRSAPHGERFPHAAAPSAVAAVFIAGPADAQEGADAVAAAFGLTPAETKVLASLFAGPTLIETATTLGITRPTAKTHLEHIFLKTGVTRQAELMRLWTGLISPAGSNMA